MDSMIFTTAISKEAKIMNNPKNSPHNLYETWLNRTNGLFLGFKRFIPGNEDNAILHPFRVIVKKRGGRSCEKPSFPDSNCNYRFNMPWFDVYSIIEHR